MDIFDANGKFDAALSRHTGAHNKVAAKGEILIRIVEFVLQFKEESDENNMTLYMLGKSHSHKAIRPWQYSIFVQTLLNTISSRLGTKATSNVMESWVNLFAYVFKVMLPPAIENQVVETESYINTSSEFAAGKIAEEVQGIEEVKSMNKKLKSLGGSSNASGSVRSSIRSVGTGAFSATGGADMNSYRQRFALAAAANAQAARSGNATSAGASGAGNSGGTGPPSQ